MQMHVSAISSSSKIPPVPCVTLLLYVFQLLSPPKSQYALKQVLNHNITLVFHFPKCYCKKSTATITALLGNSQDFFWSAQTEGMSWCVQRLSVSVLSISGSLPCSVQLGSRGWHFQKGLLISGLYFGFGSPAWNNLQEWCLNLDLSSLFCPWHLFVGGWNQVRSNLDVPQDPCR